MKKWNFLSPSKERACEISEKFNISTVSSLILSARNFSDEQISDLLNPSFGNELFDLPDIEKACSRIEKAIDSFEKIAVYGDYDCDGLCATAILYSYLESRGANVIFIVPDRFEDGYGLNNDKIDFLKSQQVSLIVTVDTGISAILEAEYIKKLQMDLIITDHHLPGETLPNCIAVVDPHWKDTDLSFRDYCGAGVAFKLICALEGECNELLLQNFGDLVALATIADVVPLVGPNRYLVKQGLKYVINSDRPGLKSLMQLSGLNFENTDSSNLAFILIPRINAAGRVGNPDKVVDLLLCEDEYEALSVANQINDYNLIRKDNQNSVYNICLDFIIQNKDILYEDVIVVKSKDLNEGVLGIVASKLVNSFSKPVIVLSESENILSGSARSVDDFSIYDALQYCEDKLVSFGGHKAAAGIKLKAENFESFKSKLFEYCRENPYKKDMLDIDLKLNSDSLNLDILNATKTLEPFGEGIRKPVFALTDLIIKEIKILGKNKNHLKLITTKFNSDRPIEIMNFFCDRLDFPYQIGDRIDVIVKFSENEFRQLKSLTIIAENIRIHDRKDEMFEKSENIYDKIMRDEKLNPEEKIYAKPEKEYFTYVYKVIRNIKHWIHSIEFLYSRLKMEDNYCRFLISVEIMKELSLVTADEKGISIVLNPKKVNLNDSKILKKLL